jgi:16S rRNA processing protein RimM
VRPHGLRGAVVVELVTNRQERLAPGSRLHCGARVLEVLSSVARRGRWLVSFSGVEDREEAEALRGQVLYAPPLADPEALWVHELVGCQVSDREGRELGRVVAVEANPAADLLVLEGERLVPLSFLVERAPGRLVVEPPPGLLEV